jgi:hypothetical protein
MKGITREDFDYLSSEVLLLPREKRRPIYMEFRTKYSDDPFALEQIDRLDRESPYHEHFSVFLKALKRQDEETAKREEKWIEKNYPLSSALEIGEDF